MTLFFSVNAARYGNILRSVAFNDDGINDSTHDSTPSRNRRRWRRNRYGLRNDYDWSRRRRSRMMVMRRRRSRVVMMRRSRTISRMPRSRMMARTRLNVTRSRTVRRSRLSVTRSRSRSRSHARTRTLRLSRSGESENSRHDKRSDQRNQAGLLHGFVSCFEGWLNFL